MFRLKEIRKECGIKRSVLSRELNINQATIANYENQTRQAPYEYLILFAEYFDVSVDYLLGRNEDETPLPKMQQVLSLEERELLENYKKLSKVAKDRVMEYICLWKK